MWTSLAGSTIIRSGGMLPSSTMQWARNQSACWHPLANAQRPLARKPPSTTVAAPVGLNVPAPTTSGPSAYIISSVAGGSLPKSTGAELPIITVQPTDPSAHGQLADEVEVFGQVRFGAAEAAGDQHAEASRRPQTRHEVERESSPTFDLVAAGHDERNQLLARRRGSSPGPTLARGRSARGVGGHRSVHRLGLAIDVAVHAADGVEMVPTVAQQTESSPSVWQHCAASSAMASAGSSSTMV